MGTGSLKPDITASKGHPTYPRPWFLPGRYRNDAAGRIRAGNESLFQVIKNGEAHYTHCSLAISSHCDFENYEFTIDAKCKNLVKYALLND